MKHGFLIDVQYSQQLNEHRYQFFDFDNVDVYFLSVKLFNLLRSFSISDPPLPITIPGLPV